MDAEAELLKAMGKDGLEQAIAEKISSFHGLLTREVALRLIAKEKGLLKEEEKEYALAEIPKGTRKIAVRATVRKIWPAVGYASGKSSRVVELEDRTGAMPLVLWNEDTELAKGLRLRDKVLVRGANERNGELHLGYSGSIEVAERASFAKLETLTEHETVHVRGFISSVEGFGTFVRGGRSWRAFSFMITDGKAERRCVLKDGTGRADRLAPGDEVIIEAGVVREGNVEVDESARLHVRRAKELLLGEVTKLEILDLEPGGHGAKGSGASGTEASEGQLPEAEALAVAVGGRELTLDRGNALRFLGVQAADDISLSTVVSLKKESVLNSKVAVKIEEKDGQVVVRG